MSTKRILRRNMIWNTTGLVIEMTVGFLLMPFLIFRLGDATYGVWIVLGALTSYFGLLDLGIRSSVGRHVALYHAQGNRAGLNQTVTGGLAVLALVGVATIVGILVGEPLFFRAFDVPPERRADTVLALRLVAVQFALFVLSTGFDATLWGFQRFDWLNAIDVPVALIRAGLTIALIRSADDLVVLAAIALGMSAATALAKGFLCFRADPQLRVGVGHLRWAALRELIEFGSWNLIRQVALVTRRQLSPLLIGSMLGLSLVAPFSVADRLILGVGAALGAVTGVLTPFATGLHATDQTQRQRQLFLVGGRYANVFALFLVAFLLVLGAPLVVLWLGPQFAGAAALLVILALGELLPSTQYVTNAILVASARHRVLAVSGVLETLAVWGLLVALLPPLGLIGCGLAIALPAVVFRGVAPMVQGCRVAEVTVGQYLLQSIVPAILCAALPMGIIGLVVWYYPPATWLSFVGCSLAYTVLFVVCSVWLGSNQLRQLWSQAQDSYSPSGSGSGLSDRNPEPELVEPPGARTTAPSRRSPRSFLARWSGVVCLNYHRIGNHNGLPFDHGLWSASRDAFDEQLRFLKSRFDMISPDDLPEILDRKRGRYVLITFDDGYRDDYTDAFPILKRHGIPATFFITTSFLDRPRLPWWDEIAWMVRMSRRQQIEVRPWVAAPVPFDEPVRERAVRTLLRAFKAMPAWSTPEFLAAVGEATGSGRFDHTAAKDLWMTWDMVREMQGAGMTIGGHTVSHPVLGMMPLDRQREEILGCGERLAAELGEPMRYFSYPVGSRSAFNDDTRACLREAGVRYAFSYYGGYCRFSEWDDYDIRRIPVETDLTKHWFRATACLPQLFAR